MWFGVAIVDFHKLLKKLMIIISNISRKVRFILKLIEKFLNPFISKLVILMGFINDYISLISLKVMKINPKLIFKIICLTCFAYQSIEMTTEYLEYRTKVNLRLVEEFFNGSEKNIETYPAISFCTSNTFTNKYESIKLDYKTYNNFERFFEACKPNKYKVCEINYTNYETILNKQTLVSDYLNVIDLRKDNIKCFLQRTGTSNNDCVEMGLIYSHYLDSKCYTFMSKLSEKFNKLLSVFGDPNINYYLSTNSREFILYIHDSNQLPSFSKSQLSSLPKDGIFYAKKLLKLLSAPYETDCFDYSGSIRSQSECINEYIIQEYLKYDCLPKSNELITYVIKDYNYTQFGQKFCENINISIKIENFKKICRKPCNEILYEILYSDKEYRSKKNYRRILLNELNVQNIAFEHEPQTVFMQYLVNFGGLLGLWHGLSFADLKNSVNHLMKRKFLLNNRLKRIHEYLPIFEKFKKIKTNSKIKVN
jgi:hypothetical protein